MRTPYVRHVFGEAVETRLREGTAWVSTGVESIAGREADRLARTGARLVYASQLGEGRLRLDDRDGRRAGRLATVIVAEDAEPIRASKA